jgi:hypothetical protein
MNVGALQAEPHARRNVIRRPMLSIHGSQAQSAIKRAVWARAGYDLPFVEMGVHVDKAARRVFRQTSTAGGVPLGTGTAGRSAVIRPGVQR